jgi:coenzyme F420-0:L-glutamate ligase/coenzyme F420-1:gamma-L-glutamate ligase
MELIPVKTRTLVPPQDDLIAALEEALPSLEDGDVVVVSAKVVAIGEGQCLKKEQYDKRQLASELADLSIPRSYWGSPITVVHHALIGMSGIDESNGNGYLVLLPKDPFVSARRLHEYLKKRHQLKNVGVILSDSKSDLFRYGATGVAIGWWGMLPLIDHRGEQDLFGRAIKAERANVVDGIAAAATVIAGEVSRQTPVVIARGIPGLTFTEGDTKEELFADFSDDKFRALYEQFLTE